MKRHYLARVSPWILATACTLLAVVIGVFAVNNYQREKQLMMEALVQKGTTIIRFVTTSSRASLRGRMGDIRGALWQWTDHVQQAIEYTSSQSGVHYVMMVDSEGKILASSDLNRVGQYVDKPTGMFLKNLEGQEKDSRIFQLRHDTKGNAAGFQVATLFLPIRSRTIVPRKMWQDFDMNSMGRMMRRKPPSDRHQNDVQTLELRPFALLVELDIEQVNKAVKQQLLQIVVLSIALILVAVGGWLSFLTLQGLKGSQLRLGRVRAFRDLLISSLPIGLIAIDRKNTIMFCNSEAEKTFAVQEAEIIGQDPQYVFPAEFNKLFVQAGTDSTAPQSFDYTFYNHDKKKRSLLLTGFPVVDAEKHYAGKLMLIQDVSPIKELEDKLRRTERFAALGKMAAGVAHELRNPLSSIKGLAVLLKSRFTDNESDKEAADILVKEVERLNRSIGELLDYARPQKLQKEALAIQDIIQKSISLIRIDADSAGVEIQHALGTTPVMVEVDQDKLKQVFLNLFINAIQAMEKGGLLEVTVSADEHQGICKVHDQGIGIAEENISRIFDPYFTTKPDGTGLGLAMSVKIVEEHGGTISVESDPHTGTIFTVRIPLHND